MLAVRNSELRTVIAVCAIGRSAQFGLNCALPIARRSMCRGPAWTPRIFAARSSSSAASTGLGGVCVLHQPLEYDTATLRWPAARWCKPGWITEVTDLLVFERDQRMHCDLGLLDQAHLQLEQSGANLSLSLGRCLITAKEEVLARNPLSPFRVGGLFGGGDPFLSLHREMNRLFDEFSRGGSLRTRQQSGTAMAEMIDTSMNVSETADEYRIKMEIPGVKEEDVEVRLDDDVLTVRGEKKFERSEGGDEENYHLVECSYGTFQRSLRLPMAVDANRVAASYENGILNITLPKSQRQERSRRIQIQGQPRQEQSKPRTISATQEDKGTGKQQKPQRKGAKRAQASSKP